MKKKDLFDLIKTLTPSEKKSIRQHAFTYKKHGDNILQKLFTLIDKQQKYDEVALKKKIPNLSNRKNELWEKIMLVLQMNEFELEAVQIRRKLDYVHILLKKRLYGQAYKVNEEALDWCNYHEQVVYKALSLGYFTSMVEYTHSSRVAEGMQQLLNLILENAERINVNMKAYDFYTAVYGIDSENEILRNPEIQRQAEKLLLHPHANLPTDKMSLHIKAYFLDAHSRLCALLRNNKKSKAIQTQILYHFKDLKFKNIVEAGVYYDALLSIMYDCQRLGEYKQWLSNLHEYKLVHDNYFTDDEVGLGYYHLQNLLCHYHTDSFRSNTRVLSETESFLETYPFKEEEIKRQLEKELCVVYFGLNDFDKAWHYNQSFIQNIKPFMYFDRQEFMRLFFLFILLEKKEWDYLKNRIKQYERYIKTKDESLYTFDKLIIEFMKKMVSSKEWRGKQMGHLRWLKKEINNLIRYNHLHTKEVLRTFNFIEWIDRKLATNS